MSDRASARMERTRGRILSAASDHFLMTGFSGTSMDEVAAAAGVSKQTVYAHFGSKEELFIAVVRSMTGAAGDRVLEQVADPTPDRPIEEFLLDYAVQQLAIVLTPRLMQLRRLVIAEVDRFPALGRELHDLGPGRSIRRLASAFEAYSAAGRIDTPDPREAASFLNWLIMGAPVNDVMLLGNDAIPGSEALRSHAEEAVRIFLAAYGTDQRAG